MASWECSASLEWDDKLGVVDASVLCGAQLRSATATPALWWKPACPTLQAAMGLPG